VSKLTEILNSLDKCTVKSYEDYFLSIMPQTTDDVFRRWLFAFCSVHTSWEANVKAYNEIKNLDWLDDEKELERRLIRSKAGLHKMRTKGIYAFSTEFYADPDSFAFSRLYRQRRKEFNRRLFGLGLAKISFASELVSFNPSCVCLDTHTLRWITGSREANGKMTPTLYNTLEQRWVDACKRRDFHPVAARQTYWDKEKGQSDCRYWSHVLES
jgi:thermostable 8-oxoguanine DNA glycosylase